MRHGSWDQLIFRFNPRPRTGGDPSGEQPPTSGQRRCTGFNPRPRTGGDLELVHSLLGSLQLCFNPRPRTGGDLRSPTSSRVLVEGLFQSTPPHRGRPGPLGPGRQSERTVSIHAPAQGATRASGLHRGIKQKVSIHAPAQGAT